MQPPSNQLMSQKLVDNSILHYSSLTWEYMRFPWNNEGCYTPLHFVMCLIIYIKYHAPNLVIKRPTTFELIGREPHFWGHASRLHWRKRNKGNIDEKGDDKCIHLYKLNTMCMENTIYPFLTPTPNTNTKSQDQGQHQHQHQLQH